MILKDKKSNTVKNVYMNCGYTEGRLSVRTYDHGSKDYDGTYEALEFGSIAEFNERFEDAPEEIKPFDEVAKEMYSVELGPSYFRSSTSVSENDRRKERTPRPKEIIIADIDYYEILPDGTMKTKFTWDEAMGIEKKTNGKWRVPTQAEWFAIAAAFGKNEAGEVTGETLAKNLNLTTDENGYGYYWSSTPSSYANARGLYFSSTGVYPQSGYNKTDGFTVRCVAR